MASEKGRMTFVVSDIGVETMGALARLDLQDIAGLTHAMLTVLKDLLDVAYGPITTKFVVGHNQRRGAP